MTVKSIARGYCGDQNAWVFHICLLPVRSENDSCRNLSAAAGRWISARRMLLRWGKTAGSGTGVLMGKQPAGYFRGSSRNDGELSGKHAPFLEIYRNPGPDFRFFWAYTF